MSTPTLLICRRCEGDDDASSGEELYQRVKALRKELGLKHVFDLEGVKCFGLCDQPCALQLEGKKRSTYVRTRVHALREVELVVQAARAYAALAPGEELAERRLPGLSD